MILTCPSCDTRYSLDSATIGSEGRTVRCARCHHDWFEFPPLEASSPTRIALDEVEPAAIPRGASPPVQHRMPSGPNWIGWAALVALVVATVAGGVLGRDHVIAVWPPSAKLYEMAGLSLEPIGLGLELLNVRSSQGTADGVSVLVVEGEVVNVSRKRQMVPRIRIAIRDGERRELQHWTVTALRPDLKPGTKTAFRTRLENPPAEAQGLVVRFEVDT